MTILQTMRAIGLMSGTSMDGIDAALIETNGDEITSFGGSTVIPYDDSFRDQLRSLMGRNTQNDKETRSVTLKFKSIAQLSSKRITF